MSRIEKYLYLAVATIYTVFGFVVFPKVFSGAWILSAGFSIGSLFIHYYGVLMAIAVGLGWVLAMLRAKRFGFDTTKLEQILFWAIISGFICARLYHVVTDYPLYLYNLSGIFQVWNGGLSIFGAIIGGLIALFFLKKKNFPNTSLLVLLSLLTPSLLLGQIIGRLGNFFNYEAYGSATTLPWGMYVPSLAEVVHPTFLYEALANAFLLLIILIIERSKFAKIFPLYLVGYGLIRFCIEWLRADSVLWQGIRINAIISLALIIFGAILLYRSHGSDIQKT